MKKLFGLLLVVSLVGIGALAILGSGCAEVVSTSTTTTTTTTTTVIAPPANLSAAATTLQATLSWEVVVGASSYNLYWSNTTGVTTASGTKIAGATAPYTHAGLTNGQTYYYVATAVNSASIESSESNQAAATPETIGVLDTSFATTGVATYDGGNDDDVGNDLVLDSSGRILICGNIRNASDRDMAIWRYTSTGILDTSFGTDGVVIYHGGSGHDSADSIAIDSSGRIVVSGYSNNGVDDDMAIWRYSSTGILDTSFGTNGVVTYEGGGGYDGANSIVLDSSNRILVCGHRGNGTNSDMAIWRYSSSGVIDATFGTTGVATYDGGSGNDVGYTLIIDSSGRIVVAGYSDTGPNRDIAVWRYSSAGVIDASFGTAGIATYVGSSGNDSGQGITIDSSGRIVVTGRIDNGATNEMIILRYSSAGSLDASFGAAGVVRYSAGIYDEGGAITLDPSGRILISGSSSNGPNDDMAIWRYSSAGVLDTGFGTSGVAIYDGGSGHEWGAAIIIDSSERVLVTGYSENAVDRDMALWRYK